MGAFATPATDVRGQQVNSRVVPPGFMGEFGSGLWRVFQTSGTFKVPPGVYKLRARVVGAGGGGALNGCGGGGGGYAHGVISVLPGDTITITVGAGGVSGTPGTAGGSSSFGSYISATGGGGGVIGSSTGAVGGAGAGGDFQASGGGAKGATGGGGSGSQLGNGGDALGPGGAGVVCSSTPGYYGGASAFASPGIIGSIAESTTLGQMWGAPDCVGNYVNSNTSGSKNPIGAIFRFPFDGFTGGGGGPSAGNGVLAGAGGPGAGGGAVYSGTGGWGNGGIGGGGGYGGSASSQYAGTGGIGGGGGGTGSTSAVAGNGGPGLVVVEW